MCVSNLCANKKISKEDANAYIDHFKKNEDGMSYKFVSSLVCYKCENKVAVTQKNCDELNNPLTIDVPYEKIPQAIKDSTHEAIKNRPSVLPPPSP